MLANTELFRTEARHFLKYGYYCPDPPGSVGYYEYWSEQLRRCTEGYSVGGMSITGHHYGYLNFKQIKLTSDPSDTSGVVKRKKGFSKKVSFPDFWDGDYEYFWLVDIARNGIDPKKMKELGLDIIIGSDWLDGGHHVMVAKARRKGFSYKNSWISANIYNTTRASKVLQIAHDKKYLYPDGVTRMTLDTLNFLNEHTAWAKRRQAVDKQDHMRASYLEYINGQTVEKGYKSEIQAITMKNNPDATRGKDANLVIMEECGAFDNLKDSLMATIPCVEDGGVVTGQIIMFGTGGDMEAGTIDFENIFYDPKPYNVIAVENIWDEGASGNCAYFFPSYKNKVGYMDKDGNSLVESAKAAERLQREQKKKARDPKALDKHITENPWNPREAFLQRTGNCFPTATLVEWRNELMRTKTYTHMATHGNLVETETGIKFKPSSNVRPILYFPHKSTDDLTGCTTIYQPPWSDQFNSIPDNLYIIVHDPYAQDTDTGLSLGVAYVIKRLNNFSKPDDMIVASYIGRPGSQDEYNYNLFLLARYYNAKIGFENDRGEVIPYARRFKKLNWLLEEAEIFDKSENVHIRKLGRTFGMSMGSLQRSEQAELYLRDWLLTPRGVNEYGDKKLNLHYIYDIALLDELIKYNSKGNFDRVSAMKVGMFHLKALHNKEVQQKIEVDEDSFFNRTLFV